MRFIGNKFVVLKGRREVHSILECNPPFIYHNLPEGWGDDEFCFGWTDGDYGQPCPCYDHGDSCERLRWDRSPMRRWHWRFEPKSCTCLPSGDYRMKPLYCGETYTHECEFCELSFNEAVKDGWEERVNGKAIDSYWASLPLHSINLIQGIKLFDDWTIRFRAKAHVWLCDECTHELDDQLQAGVTDGHALADALLH